MAYVDAIARPPYAIKSAVKVLLFFLAPLFYALGSKDKSFLLALIPSKTAIKTPAILGAALYAFILAAYFAFRPFVDFTPITASLEASYGITKANFPAVVAYFCIVNSLLEESFFRAFLFGAGRGAFGRAGAYGLSALAFAAYHTAIIYTWLAPALTALMLAGLAIGGLIFAAFHEKAGSVYPSWIIHIFCDLSIATVGGLLYFS